MKGSPRSIWLTWANRAAGWWTSAFATAAQRQTQATLKAMTPKPPRKATSGIKRRRKKTS